MEESEGGLRLEKIMNRCFTMPLHTCAEWMEQSEILTMEPRPETFLLAAKQPGKSFPSVLVLIMQVYVLKGTASESILNWSLEAIMILILYWTAYSKSKHIFADSDWTYSTKARVRRGYAQKN